MFDQDPEELEVLTEEHTLLVRNKRASTRVVPIEIPLIQQEDGALETITGQLVQLPGGTRTGSLWKDCDVIVILREKE